MLFQRGIKSIFQALSLLLPLLQTSRHINLVVLSCIDIDSDTRIKAYKGNKKKNTIKFNFKPKSKLGPRYWSKINVKNSDYFDWIGKGKNQCKGKEQSPIDIEPNEKCNDDHKINHRRGKYNFESVDFAILPNALRATLHVDENGKSARADFSNLSEWVPAVHVEIKIESEHYLFGKQYSGEFTITHYDELEGGRFIIISMMMDDRPDEENVHLEEFLREWEENAWRKENECQRRLDPYEIPYIRTYRRRNRQDMKQIWGDDKDWKSDFNLYSFLTTLWYCGYEGSLTVPPCSETVEWRVLDIPMKMSRDQHKRIRKILLNQLDDKCNLIDSIDYKESVSRPLQKNRNDVWCCDSGDWQLERENFDFWSGKWPKKYHGYKNIEG